MTLSIRTGGIYRDSRGYELVIVTRYPDGTFQSATGTAYLKDGRSQHYQYAKEDPWQLVEEIRPDQD